MPDPLPPDPSQISPQQAPAPDLGSSDPGALTPVLSGSPGSRSASGPPKMGRPILMDLISGLIKPKMEAPAPGQLARPTSRVDTLESFLSNFIGALGQGMAQGGTGPGANLRAAGAAIQAPYQRAVGQYGLEQQAAAQQAQTEGVRARTQQTQTQTAQMGQMVTLPDGTQVPFPLAGKIAPASIGAEAKTQAATIGAGARISAAQIGQGMAVDVPQDLQDKFGVPAKLPLKQLNQLESITNRPLTTVQGATDSFVVNKQTGQKRALGVGSGRLTAIMARPVQVADPSSPGGVRYMPAGEAMRSGAPAASSASVSAPKAVIKDFTSGASAKTLNSFNTATEHLKLLGQLGDALSNGSVPLINRFANSYATQTGGAAPTNFNMAKQAVAGEIAKTFKGQATEGEINSINSTLNAAQSPAQLKGAIGTALSLMESKRQALMNQYNAGVKGTPSFPAAPAGQMYARDPNGKLHAAPIGTPVPKGWTVGK